MTHSPMQSVHRLFNDRRLRRAALWLRKPLGLAVAALIVLNIRREWFWAGLGVSAAGAVLQWWCFACIKTQKELATNGPYKAVRNPMYLSRFLLVLGCVLMTGRIWAAAALVPLYYLYMFNRVRREEEKLNGVFGEPYETYCREVGRFVPFRGISSRGRWLFFSRESFLRNHGQWNLPVVLAFYVLCWYVAFVFQKGGPE